MPRLALEFALLAGLNVAVLWAVELRHRRRGKVSMLAVVGVAFLASLALHLVLSALKSVDNTAGWFVLTFPLYWFCGFLANLLAKFGWERRVPDRD